MAAANGSGSTPSNRKKWTGATKKVDRAARALRRLGVSREQLATAPAITPLLRQAEGGLAQVLRAMRFAPDPLLASFLTRYDSLPVGDRDHLSLEAIALAAGIEIPYLLGSIMVALQAQSVSMVKIIALTAHPKITAARARYGQRPLGERDRTALDTALGFLPSPKGPTFIGKAIFGAGQGVRESSRDPDEIEASADDSPDMDRLFPPANNMQQKLTPIRQERLLPSGE